MPSSNDYYLTCYLAEEVPFSPDFQECAFCGELVDELVNVREWHVSGWEWYDVCRECAKEGDE